MKIQWKLLISLIRALSLIIIFSFIRCSDDPVVSYNSGYVYTEPVSTGDGWGTASLNSVGINEEPIVNLVLDINNGVFTEIHSIVIIKENKLVFEKYWSGHDFGYTNRDYLGARLNFNINTRHNTHSATKSFASALIGIAIDKGFIQNENDSIFDYLQDFFDQWNNEGRENITIKHCLMMASGLEWNEWDVSVSNTQHDIVRFNQNSSPVRYLLMKPLVTEPGARFYYNGGTVDLLGVILDNASGQTVPAFSRDYLFEPLGITNYNWQTLQPSGITCCHGDVYITPRDMAKFGYLFLNDGQWNGEQLISEEWVERSIQNQISPGVSWADGYGYLWWLRDFHVNGNAYHSFKAIGWGGQEIFVFKELNLVIVFTGANYVTDPPCDEMVRDYILPALL